MSEQPKTSDLFDVKQIINARLRAQKRNFENFLLQRLLEDLQERLSFIKRTFHSVLDFGSPNDALSASLATKPNHFLHISPLNNLNEVHIQGTHDCIIAMLSLETLNDIAKQLSKLRNHLEPDGLFIGALIGGQSLFELRHSIAMAESKILGGISPRIHPNIEIKDMGTLLQRSHFAMPVIDSEIITVRYHSPIMLMHDLRNMGLTNGLSNRHKTPMTKALLQEICTQYHTNYAHEDGKIPATFEIIWFSAWAPHPSQQKPLKPGSAQINLKDILENNHDK